MTRSEFMATLLGWSGGGVLLAFMRKRPKKVRPDPDPEPPVVSSSIERARKVTITGRNAKGELVEEIIWIPGMTEISVQKIRLLDEKRFQIKIEGTAR